jgi:hypothetical protein
MRDMIQSDEEVLRVAPPPHAAPIDYLRGSVFDEYSVNGSWSSSLAIDKLQPLALAASGATPSAPMVSVRRVAGDATRYFLPLRARSLVVPGGRVLVEGGGAVRTVQGARATEYRFVVGDRDELAPLPPTPMDLQVPASERAALAQLARGWIDTQSTTPPPSPPEAKLEAIRAHLTHGYTYSLSFSRDADDPLLDFLYSQKLGYCTYFASGMVMLARTAGIPARLVAGYRVAEWSPITGEWVIREKNAHAWVEAWVSGAWRTYDPTPMSDLPQDAPHVAPVPTLLADAVAAVEQAVAYTLTHVTPAQLFVLLLLLVALWALVRRLRARARGASRASLAPGLPRPLPCFERLAVAAMSRAGIARAPSEPLERFAARLADAGLVEAASLVERYAALRYGGFGDQGTLEGDVERFLRG